MNDKPVLFSGAMVRAILEGKKTQTRRVINPQIDWQEDIFQRRKSGTIDQFSFLEFVARCPYGQVGDRLWVRETWLEYGENIYYRATDGAWQDEKWKPSIFMPRWASRITLEVVSIRVERVQDITRDDAKAEGVSNLWSWDETRNAKHPEHFCRGVLNPYIANYSVLWDDINAARGFGWDANPWVWVVEFKVVTK